jgi:two-component system LytT family response regulator/two-component system response regulator AlgR
MSDALRVIVAEDEPYNRKRIARLLREAGCVVVVELPDGPAVFEWLEAGGQADAAFLDIEMPGATGLEVALDLPSSLPVVFVTAFAEHAVRAFEAAALDYLLKPATPERIAIALARVRERRTGSPSAKRPAAPLRYPVRAGEGLVFMELARTSHFLVEDEVVWAYVSGERHRTTWKSLTEAEASFPRDVLVKGHRNMLLRPEAVLSIKASDYGRASVRLQGGLTVEVSRGAAPGLKARLGLA